MKAGHRKELQTNILADNMGKFFKGAQSSTGLIWVFLLAGVLLVVGLWWWRSQTKDAISVAWIDLWNSRETAAGAKGVSDRFKGTAAARAARLVEADHLYDQAYGEFFRSPDSARDIFRQASDIYQEVGENHGNSPDLAVRAYLGAAKCQEWIGERERAVFFYDQVTSRFDTHPLADEAKQRKEYLQTQGDALAFYHNWPYRLPTMTATSAGGGQ